MSQLLERGPAGDRHLWPPRKSYYCTSVAVAGSGASSVDSRPGAQLRACVPAEARARGNPRGPPPLGPSPSPSRMWSSWDALTDAGSSPPESRALPLRAGGAGCPGPRPMSAGRARHLPSCRLPFSSLGAPGPPSPHRRWKNVSCALWFPIFPIWSPESEKSGSAFPKTGGNGPVNQQPPLRRPAQDAEGTSHCLVPGRETLKVHLHLRV